MTEKDNFQLLDFLPYLLDRAAEVTSHSFQRTYKDKYGMLRTEWRVLFHLGRYGDLTAKEISQKSDLHKTKISRAVSSLESRRFLTRTEKPHDRRHETLTLTPQGRAAFDFLEAEAKRYNEQILASFTQEEQAVLRRLLLTLAKSD